MIPFKMRKYITIFLALVLLVSCNFSKAKYITNDGQTQGTYYHIVYEHPEGKDLHPDIDQLLSKFDFSLSTYNSESLISAINQNQDSVKTDTFFEEMYKEAVYVSEMSNGAFDITVAPLVNLWGFGFDEEAIKSKPDVNAVLPLVGYKKVRLVNHRIIKENKDIMLDASAIAQGYSSDVVGAFLEENGCKNYMVEIGGEIFCRGQNAKKTNWQVGIDKPVDDPANENEELQEVLSISNVGLATSGNYRKFYYKDGRKFAHTINPKTGYPVEHNLLSATVIAKTSMRADAFATAFMVVGKDSAMALCARVPDMDCYLIYSEGGENKVVYTPGFKKYLNIRN